MSLPLNSYPKSLISRKEFLIPSEFMEKVLLHLNILEIILARKKKLRKKKKTKKKTKKKSKKKKE